MQIFWHFLHQKEQNGTKKESKAKAKAIKLNRRKSPKIPPEIPARLHKY